MPDSDEFSGSRRILYDVFISYAKPDKRVADAVCAALESHEFRCWIAPRDVPPGTEFPKAIIEGIERSGAMVLIFSSHSNDSPHVLRELTNAVNKGRIIVPFRIEDIQPSKSMEYLISVPNWLDAFTPPLEKHIDELVGIIGDILLPRKDMVVCAVCSTSLSPIARFCEKCGAPVSLNPISPPPPEAGRTPTQQSVVATPPSPRVKRRMVIGAVIVILILAALYLVLPIIPTQLLNPVGIHGGWGIGAPAPIPTTAVDYRSSNTPINTVVLTAGPTQALPNTTQLIVVADKDPVTLMVNIIFEGGPGQGLVQDNQVILTRSDGTVTTGKLDFNNMGSEVKLQGTRGTDRLQVIVTMYSGKTYTIEDELIPGGNLR